MKDIINFNKLQIQFLRNILFTVVALVALQVALFVVVTLADLILF